MRQRNRVAWLACALLAASWVGAGHADDTDTLAKLSTCMRANIPESLRVQTVQFVTTERDNAERRLIGRVVASRHKELTRVNLRLQAPYDLKDAAYLARETGDGRDEIYLYLPALNRVRRVTGGSRNNSVFGTDFSYNDLRQMHAAFAGNEVSLRGEVELDGRPAWHLSVSQDDPEEGPRDLEAWVDTESCVSRRIDVLQEGQVVRRISSPAESLRTLPSGQWYADAVTVENLLTESQTVLTVLGIEIGEDISETLFNPRTFYIGP